MYYDLGGDVAAPEPELRSWILELDRMFDIVLISNLMEESLILMKNLLCWTMDDIIVFNTNVRSKEKDEHMNPRHLKNLKMLNHADELLYKYFLEKHHKAVEKFGTAKMREEIATLKSRTLEYYHVCKLGLTDNRNNLKKFINVGDKKLTICDLFAQYGVLQSIAKDYQRDLVKNHMQTYSNTVAEITGEIS